MPEISTNNVLEIFAIIAAIGRFIAKFTKTSTDDRIFKRIGGAAKRFIG